MSTRKVTVRAPARTGKRQASATGQKFLKRCCILLGGGSLPVFRTGGSFYSRQVIVELKSRNFGSQKIIPEIARRAAVSCLPGEADCSGRSLPGSGKKRYHPEMVPIPTRASGPYKCRASISLRATLMNTSSRSFPAKRSLISSAVPAASTFPPCRKRTRSQTSSMSRMLCEV